MGPSSTVIINLSKCCRQNVDDDGITCHRVGYLSCGAYEEGIGRIPDQLTEEAVVYGRVADVLIVGSTYYIGG